jgi:hypothetical protein
LRLLPFELRFLAGKRAPDRLVIDLSSDSGVRLEPTDYPTIEYLENLPALRAGRVCTVVQKQRLATEHALKRERTQHPKKVGSPNSAGDRWLDDIRNL